MSAFTTVYNWTVRCGDQNVASKNVHVKIRVHEFDSVATNLLL